MSRPNLLHILSDQHTASIMGCAGDPVALTPNLDRLAARGTRLTDLYCASPICVPSRMSMLTGRHPSDLRVWTNDHALGGGHATWPHALGAAGYRPQLAGRLHSIGADQLLGFTERFVGDHSPNHPGGRLSDLGVLMGTAGPHRISLERSGSGSNPYERHDVDVVAAAVQALDEHGARLRAADGPPFALSVGLMLPHQPYVAAAQDYARFAGRVPAPRNCEVSDHPYIRWWREHTGIEAVTAEECERARTAYYAMVYRLDAMIGEILEALEANGLAENTLVVYTSDHGDHLGEHGLWWKQTFYEESVAVPGIISWPGHIPEGAVCERVASALDLTATMLDALSAPPLPNARGRSLLGLLRRDADAEASWADEAFSEFCTDDGWIQRMIRSGPWKLTYCDQHSVQLFNLVDDPAERHDLAGSEEHANTVERLRARVLEHWDPARVRREMAVQRRDTDVLMAWAAAVQPADSHRWTLVPDMSMLDGDGNLLCGRARG